MDIIFKYIININYLLRGMLTLIFFLEIFSYSVEANPYFSLLASAPQSAKMRVVQESTNEYMFSAKNNVGTISNLTMMGWMRTEADAEAAIMYLLATKENKSNGEDVLGGELGWDDSWLALTGETNITTTLATNIAYCLVGTSENTCDIDYGGVTNTVDGDFDFLANNFDNKLRINTTGNFRMGMIPAETNRFIHATLINKDYNPETGEGGGYQVDESWGHFTLEASGTNSTCTVKKEGTNTVVYTKTYEAPFAFEKNAIFQLGMAHLSSNPHTNMFFDTRAYARILSDEEKDAIRFDGKIELEERGLIQ